MDLPKLRLLEEAPCGHPVNCLINKEADALDNDEMEPDVAALIFEFNGYSLSGHIDEVGDKEKVRARLTEAQALYDGFCSDTAIESRIARVLERISALQPGFELPAFPIYFIFAGSRTGGRSMKGRAIVVNLGEVVARFRKSEFPSPFEAYGHIEDTMVHEGVHVLSFAMGTGDIQTRVPRFSDIWGEGLGAYSQHDTKRYKSVSGKELEFWIKFLNTWRTIDTDEGRLDIIETYVNPDEENLYITSKVLVDLRKWIERGEHPEVVFTELLKRSDVLYGIGLVLWRSRIEKGEDVVTLVREGPDNFEKWVEDMARELESCKGSDALYPDTSIGQ